MEKLTEPILLIGAPTEVTDLRYRTAFPSNDAVVYLELKRERHMVVSSLDLEHAQCATRGINVWAPGDLGLRHNESRTLCGWTLALLRKLNVRSVTVPTYFPVGIARKLSKARVIINVSEDALFPRRQVKTDAERTQLRKCQGVAVKAMRVAVRMIADAGVSRSGVLQNGKTVLTSAILRLCIERLLFQEGCLGTGTIVAVGLQAVCPHEPGRGPLRRDESIIIDIFPRDLTTGYWGDLTRTIVKGKAGQMLRKMHKAVHEAQLKAFSTIKAGVSAASVHKTVVNTIKEHGFTNGIVNGKPQGFIHGTGHGIGLDIHEPPSIAYSRVRLKAGNVVTVEPGLYYREAGGVRIEDVVAITPSGCEILKRCEPFFEIQ